MRQALLEAYWVHDYAKHLMGVLEACHCSHTDQVNHDPLLRPMRGLNPGYQQR